MRFSLLAARFHSLFLCFEWHLPVAGAGIKQPNVSALMRNRSGSFSVERLMDFLTALGQDVEITVRPTRKEQGEVSVVVA